MIPFFGGEVFTDQHSSFPVLTRNAAAHKPSGCRRRLLQAQAAPGSFHTARCCCCCCYFFFCACSLTPALLKMIPYNSTRTRLIHSVAVTRRELKGGVTGESLDFGWQRLRSRHGQRRKSVFQSGWLENQNQVCSIPLCVYLNNNRNSRFSKIHPTLNVRHLTSSTP